jgi:hypothetical protein
LAGGEKDSLLLIPKYKKRSASQKEQATDCLPSNHLDLEHYLCDANSPNPKGTEGSRRHVEEVILIPKDRVRKKHFSAS